MERKQPFTVEVTRGTMVESRHRGAAAVVSADGKVVESWGDLNAQIYPRSSIKPLQALPLIETGAADAFDVSAPEVALACASHLSQPHHVKGVNAWLARLDLGAQDLECGAHRPRSDAAFEQAIRDGVIIDRTFNNCSGKHSGFLTTARHLGESTDGYSRPDHPVQERLLQVLSELGGEDLSATARGIDGCGIPVVGMPLSAMAQALARMADPAKLPPVRRGAAERIFRAMTEHPEYVRGHGGWDTVLMAVGKGRVATKTGAEGIHAGIVPSLGLGIAIKIEDGNNRASEVAMGAILDHLGILNDNMKVALAGNLKPVIPNAAGDTAGEIRMAAGWAD